MGRPTKTVLVVGILCLSQLFWACTFFFTRKCPATPAAPAPAAEQQKHRQSVSDVNSSSSSSSSSGGSGGSSVAMTGGFWGELRGRHPGAEGYLVVLPTTRFDNVPYQRPSHVARSFARAGWVVLYAAVLEFDPRTAFQEGVDAFHELESNVYELRKLPPRWQQAKAAQGEGSGSEAKQQGGRILLWAVTYNANLLEVVSRSIGNGTRVESVYDVIDSFEIWKVGKTPSQVRTLRERHERAVRGSTYVAYVAKPLLQQDPLLAARKDAIYLPNAVSLEDFTHVASRPRTAEEWRMTDPLMAWAVEGGGSGRKLPIVGFYGYLAEWFDWELLVGVAAARQDLNFVIVGPPSFNLGKKSPVSSFREPLAMMRSSLLAFGSVTGTDGSRFKKSKKYPQGTAETSPCDPSFPGACRRNVVLIGPKNYREMPAYVGAFDVATIIFGMNEASMGASPLKLYEYLAAGKPIVSTPLPECLAFSPKYLLAAGTTKEFAAALDVALERGRDPSFAVALRAVVANHTWQARYREFVSHLVVY